MDILTTSHAEPPIKVETPTGAEYFQHLLHRLSYAELSALGLYRHVSIGDGPYTEWTLIEDEDGPLYQRETRERTPKEAEAYKRLLLKNLYRRRVQAELSPFLHEGRRYDGGDDSVKRFATVSQQITWALMAGADASTVIIPGGWRDVDGVGGPQTISEVQSMFQSHYTHMTACEANSQRLKQEILKRTDVDIDLGWP
jgi:hypothetical protein